MQRSALPEPARRGLAEHLRRHAAAVEAAGRLGWKLAFNVQPIQQRLQLPGSLVAGLTRRTLLERGRAYSVRADAQVALEAEVAVRLGCAVAATDVPAQVARAVTHWAPAIEVLELDRPFDELEQILAEGVFHRGVVLGEWRAPSDAVALRGLKARVWSGDEPICEVDAEQATGDVRSVLTHVAALLEPFGHSLQAGDVLILGSMNPPTRAHPNSQFRVEIDRVGEVSLELSS